MAGMRPDEAEQFYEEDEGQAKVFAIFEAAKTQGRLGRTRDRLPARPPSRRGQAMQVAQSKHHTESRTFHVPDEVIMHQCGLDESWQLTYARTGTQGVEVRFERKMPLASRTIKDAGGDSIQVNHLPPGGLWQPIA